MKKIFVTYIQDEILKKAEINEEKYSKLNVDQSISELTIYSSPLLMEQSYEAKMKGKTNTKRFLHG